MLQSFTQDRYNKKPCAELRELIEVRRCLLRVISTSDVRLINLFITLSHSCCLPCYNILLPPDFFNQTSLDLSLFTVRLSLILAHLVKKHVSEA